MKNLSLSNYLNVLSELKYSDSTIRTYEYCLKHFAKYIATNYQGMRWSTIDTATIQQFINDLAACDIEAQSIHTRVSAISTYYRWMKQQGADIKNPTQGVRYPRAKKCMGACVERELILKVLNDGTISGMTRAIIALMWETGIRISEMEAMTTGDVEPTKQRIKIHGKGNKERYVYYGLLSRHLMNQFLHHRGTIVLDDDREIRYKIHCALRKHGGKECASPHCIRRGFAQERLNDGMDIKILSQLMGHEQVTTTERYARYTDANLGAAARAYLN